MIYVNIQKEKCCGCTACYSICPKHAISMVSDEKGFSYPQVDKEKCVDCGLCDKVCAFSKSNQFSYNETPIAAYAIKHKDENVRANSRSGGAFVAISEYVIKHGGCVYGAAFDDEYNVIHKKATTIAELKPLCKSKYVQSDLKSSFCEIKNQLENGQLVAFSGTACQVAGLHSYLGKEYLNLITIDIVCHGVPSPKIWKEYLQLVRSHHRGMLQEVQFRDKGDFGWAAHIESYIFNNKKYYLSGYSKLFCKDYILRDSCFNCQYTNLRRPADFTLADFWGIDKVISNFNDNKGVSLLLINSLKADTIFKGEVKNSVIAEECTSNFYIQPNLKHPEKKPDDLDEFWDRYKKNGIKDILKQYSNWNLKDRIKSKIDMYKLILQKIK